jgi:hypothetical protein
MPKRKIFNLTLLFIFLLSVPAISAQNKRNQRTKPADAASQTGATAESTAPAAPPAYVWEFFQPSFVISHILIEHDENGKGKITFKKKDLDEEFTDPIELSQTTLDKLNAHFEALNFIESDENYQFEKDYSHLGNVKITRRMDGKERTAEFNWTTNEKARALTGEYRKIANQYIWMFDITVARQNQPLETPRIIKALDGYLKRGEISDPPQMVPFLKDLSNDERVPLITRNNAAKLVQEIEKKKKN